MNKQHVDMIGALQRGKSDRRILYRGNQREFTGQPLAELLFVVSGAGPRLLLRLAVVVAGQFLDGGDKDRRQHGHILAEERSQRGFRHCLSHVRTLRTVVSGRARSRQ